MSSEITAAATASAHQSPRPMPSTPIMAAPAVSQSALFMVASACSTLSCSASASGSLARPSAAAGSALHSSAGSINHPSHTC